MLYSVDTHVLATVSGVIYQYANNTGRFSHQCTNQTYFINDNPDSKLINILNVGTIYIFHNSK